MSLTDTDTDLIETPESIPESTAEDTLVRNIPLQGCLAISPDPVPDPVPGRAPELVSELVLGLPEGWTGAASSKHPGPRHQILIEAQASGDAPLDLDAMAVSGPEGTTLRNLPLPGGFWAAITLPQDLMQSAIASGTDIGPITVTMPNPEHLQLLLVRLAGGAATQADFSCIPGPAFVPPAGPPASVVEALEGLDLPDASGLSMRLATLNRLPQADRVRMVRDLTERLADDTSGDMAAITPFLTLLSRT
jgi:hypothetical protein